MEDTLTVDTLDCAGDFLDQFHGSGGVAGKAAKALGQAAASGERHRKIVLTVLLPYFENRHDVRMVKLCGSFRLAQEAHDLVATGQRSAADHLESHNSVEH